MKHTIRLFVLSALCFSASAVSGKGTDTDSAVTKKVLPPIRKFYIGTAYDGGIFSTATIQRPGTSPGATNNTMGTLRFTYFVNFGVTFNFNLNRHFGLYTGIDLKNVGFIEQDNGFTIKRRTYNVGAPLGVKIGNMGMKRGYVFFGGGADVPVNYREKKFQVRNQKTKFNEWFSDRTSLVMPYVFAGAAFNYGLTLKVQYYPNNYLNPDFTDKAGLKPYAGYDVHLILFSVGFALPISKHHDMVKKNVTKLNSI